VFSTASDNQDAVTIHVLQGERKVVEGNKSLGQFNLVGIPPAPKGTPKIEVIFDIDANGILHVSAKDQSTGKENSIKITASSGLSTEEINKLIQEANEQKSKDEEKIELINSINNIDNLLHQYKKENKLNEEDYSFFENKLKTLSNLSEVKSLEEEINKKLQ